MTTHLDIIKRLCDNGCDTFIVGGAVRDLFTDGNPDDFDIVTAATPEQIEHLFEGFDVRTVGKSFGVVLVDGFEVATFRHDRYNELLDARKTTVVYANSIHEDLSRRDLTINALALCEITGELVDDFNGVQDLERKIIRFVGDPAERIKEDPNRIVRAARFLAKIDGKFEETTLHALRDHAHYVDQHVAEERIREEVLKAMKLETPSLFFAALHLIGALEYVFPALERALEHEGHGDFHKESVWEHLMLVGDSISPRFPLVRLAGYLHDVGKPPAYTENEGKNFGGHDKIGTEVVRNMLESLRFSKKEVDTVANLVRSHMWLGNEDVTAKSVRKVHARFEEYGIEARDWLRLRVADRKGNVTKEPFTLQDIRKRANNVGIGAAVPEAPKNTHQLALGGGELIAELGLVPGPVVGKLQKALFDHLIEVGWEHNTKEELLKKATELLEKAI